MPDTVVILGFGLFLWMGAYFGWKAGSRVSLTMGLVSGLLVFAGYAGFAYGPSPKCGLSFLAIIGAALAAVFFQRLRKTKKMMPSGMLMIISIAFALYCVIRLYSF